MNKKAEKILNATIELLLRYGVPKITMDEIAACSNASKVTVYKYFVDKDTLIFEVGRYILSRYRTKLINIVDSNEILVRKLYSYLDVLSSFANSGEFELCRELGRYNTDVKAEYENYLVAYRHSMLALIDAGLEQGLIHNRLDRQSIFYYIDMSVAYYQQNDEYRYKFNHDDTFKERFLLFYTSNIFTDGAQLLKEP